MLKFVRQALSQIYHDLVTAIAFLKEIKLFIAVKNNKNIQLRLIVKVYYNGKCLIFRWISDFKALIETSLKVLKLINQLINRQKSEQFCLLAKSSRNEWTDSFKMYRIDRIEIVVTVITYLGN